MLMRRSIESFFHPSPHQEVDRLIGSKKLGEAVFYSTLILNLVNVGIQANTGRELQAGLVAIFAGLSGIGLRVLITQTENTIEKVSHSLRVSSQIETPIITAESIEPESMDDWEDRDPNDW